MKEASRLTLQGANPLLPAPLPLRSYPSDDINKFLWMVRIGGGVFPDIKEPNYLSSDGGPLAAVMIGWLRFPLHRAARATQLVTSLHLLPCIAINSLLRPLPVLPIAQATTGWTTRRARLCLTR